MSDSMIERVARAISPGMWASIDAGMARQDVIDRRFDDARAALEAMREPTEAVVHEGWMANGSDGSEALSVWSAMIDAALSEEA